MSEALLGIGTNIGNKIENIETAVKSISLLPRTRILTISKIYETSPFDVPDKQDNYLNCCLKVSTELNPYILLGSCMGIEASANRQRLFHHCSRTLDIDILAYDNKDICDKNLTIPHPEIKKRAFVMVPLSDICTDMKFGVLDFYKEINTIDKSDIKLFNYNIKDLANLNIHAR